MQRFQKLNFEHPLPIWIPPVKGQKPVNVVPFCTIVTVVPVERAEIAAIAVKKNKAKMIPTTKKTICNIIATSVSSCTRSIGSIPRCN